MRMPPNTPPKIQTKVAICAIWGHFFGVLVAVVLLLFLLPTAPCSSQHPRSPALPLPVAVAAFFSAVARGKTQAHEAGGQKKTAKQQPAHVHMQNAPACHTVDAAALSLPHP